ncbi:hypothetical protein TI05_09690, partial [Achromatium sp. WMS3]
IFWQKKTKDISIAEIICAVDEWVEFTRCAGRENCQSGQRCLNHSLWNALSSEIFDFLDHISLAHLVERGTQNQNQHLSYSGSQMTSSNMAA